ncbi:YfbU family protein [Clostridioides mangenotii]|uniref:YfbU family protein n=1 Tax=Metaclostridioides mangenotii TaxID=1540 RepID=UPI001C114613|nr:YfbU family protein [Clostridioides mangenotii]MBU5306265.1 YfbU family protein [Clostridioides mangenotii]
MELSSKERLFLFNQYEILKHLDKDNVKTYLGYQEIIRKGFKYNYIDLIEGINKDGTEENVSKFVFDVFELHRMLIRSYNDLSRIDKTRINKYDIIFRGYDVLEEINYYTYAKFIIEDLGLYKDIIKEEGFKMDSRVPMVEIYRKRILEYKDVLKEPFSVLNINEIKELIKIN